MRAYTPTIMVFVAVGCLWEASVDLFKLPEYLLPAPSAVLADIVSHHAALGENLWVTMEAACLGLILGTGLALSLAMLFLSSRTLERALFPWAIILQTVPVLAIAPLLTIWLGFGIAPKIAVAAIITIFPVLVNTARGLKAANIQMLEMMSIVGASSWQTFREVRIFAALPYLFSGLRIGCGSAVIGAIVAEFTGANKGIGTMIVAAGYRQDATLLFAAIFCSCAATLALFYIVVGIERACLFWPDARSEI
jgi:NitT/TauT family transport system permease protein